MSAATFVREGNRGTRPDRSSDVAPANHGVDRDAVRFVYERHADAVYRYLRGMVGRDDAEDLTQQVFLKLIVGLGRYEPRSDVPFSAWLRRVAHNLAVDYLRSARPYPVDATRHVRARDDDGASERAESLLEALAELPASQREVVMLRYMAGLSPGEIATTLGRSEDSIHCLHHRARGRLKRELTRRGAAPQTLARAA
jgi:RNA polymerase sigma-70 factor (ECF subfamily)